MPTAFDDDFEMPDFDDATGNARTAPDVPATDAATDFDEIARKADEEERLRRKRIRRALYRPLVIEPNRHGVWCD